ncbi:Nif3-like dinuclear metal center hexameric protein [Gryllotalpicola daejeonensis]|uniref:GTP cyclohydrolase 1 type 2 homolog n=1 Tax=Gryllotalpicola daejeonensis TaxID=993087 RepID=A0ABP7ZFA2_9MICO
MPYALSDVLAVAERLWPVSGAEGWDAPGLVSGSPTQSVASIHLVVDAVAESLDDAIAAGADLVIAHHPLLMFGVKSVAETHYKGSVLAKLIRSNTALLAAHTNADVVADGTSAVLAEKLGLIDTRPIVPSAAEGTGLGRVGRLADATSLGRLARAVADVLPPTAGGVRVAGSYDLPVQTVAVCGGAGDSLLSDPAVVAADVYLTADLRHHPASEAREQHLLGAGPALIDVSHWASEWLWLERAATQLRQALPEASVTVSEVRTDPWDFAIVQ